MLKYGENPKNHGLGIHQLPHYDLPLATPWQPSRRAFLKLVCHVVTQGSSKNFTDDPYESSTVLFWKTDVTILPHLNLISSSKLVLIVTTYIYRDPLEGPPDPTKLL